MKQILKLFFVFSCLLAFSCSQAPTDPFKEVAEFQEELNAQFADSEESPLKDEDWILFEGLEFFPVDTSFRVIARLEFHEENPPFTMPTTTDRLPMYKRFATAHFNLGGKMRSLEIYQNLELIQDSDYSDYLFLPFTDKTNGEESYGGGRYIDLEIPDGKEIIIDFNQSYNPYCAYNEEYSCPIPPRVNDLNIEIRAGIKAFGDH